MRRCETQQFSTLRCIGGPSTHKLTLFGVAVGIPLAAVALYFAIFERPMAAPPSGPTGEAGPAQPALPPDHPPVGGQSGEHQTAASLSVAAGHPQVISGSRAVRVPQEVQGKWRAVKLRVEAKDGGMTAQVFTVTLGGLLDIPGSTLRIRIGDFLPALQVSENEVTSASNDPTNPAVMVTVSEGARETFRGWLFAKFPEMQPFEHSKYRISLVEGVPAS